MKKITILCLLVLTITACKKEDISEPQTSNNKQPYNPTITEQITGIWYGKELTMNVYSNTGTLLQTSEEDITKAKYNFKKDGTLLASSTGQAEYEDTWEYDEPNKTFYFAKSPFSITKLTDINFEIINRYDTLVNNKSYTIETIMKLIK